MLQTFPIFRMAALLAIVAAPFAVGGAASGAAPASPGLLPAGPVGECDGVDQSAIADSPIVEAIGEVDELTTLSAAIDAAGLGDQLEDGPFTVFAPSNDAFEAIPENVFDSIVADLDLLSSILGYHVVVGDALSADELVAAGTVDTTSGPLDISLDGETLVVNDADVTCAGIHVADATVYVIDRVLQPTSSVGTTGSSSVPGSSVPGSSVPGSSVPE